MENKKSYHIDPSRLTVDQQYQLETYKQAQDQLTKLEDIALILQDLSNVADENKKNTDQIKAIGAVLTDAREQLVQLNSKEVPETPDTAKPIVEAITKLEKILSKLDVKPQVNVNAPNVWVDAPDLTDFNNILKKEIPVAFKDALKAIPKVEIPKTDNTELLKVWEGISEQLVSIETATRMKPLPGLMKVTNPDGSAIGSVSSSVIYITVIREKTGDPQTTYIGKALPGTATSDASWQIASLDENTNLDLLYADGGAFTQVYDNREGLTYA